MAWIRKDGAVSWTCGAAMLRVAAASRSFIRGAARTVPRALLTTSSDSAISRFPSPATHDHLPSHLQDRLTEVSDKAGFTPNIFKALWRRPAELEAFWDYHDAVMKESDELSKADREAIARQLAFVNDALQCTGRYVTARILILARAVCCSAIP